MEVNLIGYMQLTPNMWSNIDERHEKESESELIAATIMHSCKTHDDFLTIANEMSTKTVKNRIKGAIKLGHFTVPGFTEWIFEIRGVSRAMTHQLVRHRTGWFMQQSQRTVDPTIIVSHMEPEGDDWYNIPETIENTWWLKAIFIRYMRLYKDFYQYLVSRGVPREDARFVLPEGCKSNIYMKMDGSNLLHFLKLRLDRHAQWEIKYVAEEMHKILKKEAPNIFSDSLKGEWW